MGNIEDFAAFKECMTIQTGLDMEVWDVALFQPLKDIHTWVERQSQLTVGFVSWIAANNVKALEVVLKRALQIGDEGLIATFAVLLTAVAAGIGLGTFLDVVGRCIIQQVS